MKRKQPQTYGYPVFTNAYSVAPSSRLIGDDGGQPRLDVGNTALIHAKLNRDIITIDTSHRSSPKVEGAVIDLPLSRVGNRNFTEDTWQHNLKDICNLTYPADWGDVLIYYTSTSPQGTWNIGNKSESCHISQKGLKAKSGNRS